MTQIPIPTSFPSQADSAAIVAGPQVRFTVLTSRLIRLEYSRTNRFEDRASQVFWYRRQPVPPFKVKQTPEQIEIVTDHLHLRYRVTDKGFTPKTLSIQLKASGVTWHFGDRDRHNLHGTARTLDGADGPIPLEPGLMSRAGWSVVDDSRSLIFEEGWLELRSPVPETDYYDLYFFGYGHDYVGCLQDYGRVAGRVPLVPRWALGNWWSRYWAYTQDELRDLMIEFQEKEVPLSVCIIDMDWHITETGNESSGWTGYTWNRELFPDPYGLIAWLHEQGLKTALNLHPAEGIHPHEAMYAEMARFMGIDPDTQEPVPFDIADPQFTQGYFQILHHPYEERGVDFWWIDWQQGQRIQQSRRPVAAHMDPLWWLNHLHFYDLGRDGRKRPFIFSRWGGLGNHRYPIGFSGDSIITWQTLAFQPYFTATAANVAFGWWSHDIGGHTSGIEDDELYARWVQLGVFSPILRLHSTNNPYHDRRPWGRGDDVFRVTREAMQLRHTLIPYIYSMAWRAFQDSIPLITPLYYSHPENAEAYQCPGEYWFGTELIAAPFVTPRHTDTGLSRQTIWLPEGDWFDFFSSEHFPGGRWVTIHGTLDEIPVFARAGSIVPMGPRVGWGGIENPAGLTVHIFAGADGNFTLYEDDGNSTAYLNGQYSLTRFSQNWRSDQLQFKIEPVEGNARYIPTPRGYRLVLHGIRNPDDVQLEIRGAPQNLQGEYDPQAETFSLPAVALEPTDGFTLRVSVTAGSLLSKRDRRMETCRKLLRAFRLESLAKWNIDEALPELLQEPGRLARFRNALTDAQWAALNDVLRQRGTP